MKTTFTLLLLGIFTLGVSAQEWLPLPETFEVPYSDTVWEQFGNGETLPEFMMRVDNDNWDDTNDSEFCLEFLVQETAETWAGAWSDSYGPMEITEDN